MRNRPLLSGCLMLFLLISLCIITGGAKFVKELRPSVLEKKISGEAIVRVSGQVYDIDRKEKYQILYLSNNSIIYQNKSFKESKVIIYDEEKLNIEIGNKIEVSGRMSFYESERNPGNFNQKLYYQKQGIRASVWAVKVTVLEESVDEIRNLLYQFRQQWEEVLCEMMGEENGAILTAMLLAEKSGMDEETKELYQANGMAHVLAISGLHLSIIGVGLYRLIRRISGSFWVGGMAGSVFLVLYILMIGMSVSVLRALIMFLFRVGADMAGRHYDSPTALSVAALVTIFWKPLCLYDGGFWLSYGAILGIIMVLPIFEKLSFQGFWASVSINLMTLPILLCYFFEVPPYSVILNMIVIPLMTVILLCGLVGSGMCVLFVADGIFGSRGIGGGLFWICKIILAIYEKCCEMFLKLPSARIVAGQPEIWQMVVYYACLVMIVILCQLEKKRKNTVVRVWKLAAISMLVFSMCVMTFPCSEREKLSVTMLDVGQGDGIFIRGPEGNTYLIDGGSSDEKKLGKYKIEPFLKSQGVRKLDYVFISHGDGDHISGIKEMTERMDIGISIETIVFPLRESWDENLTGLARLAMENGARVVTVSAGEQLVEGEMTLTCLAPVEVLDESADEGESNAKSMVLALNYRDFDMLFTGDVEKEGEEILTEVLKKNYQNTRWEVLKVAHHGSKNSSSGEFLGIVNPLYALISAGRDNSYGHPHTETLKRLEDVGSKVLSTQENGAITVVTDGEKMSVEGYLNEGGKLAFTYEIPYTSKRD